LKRGEVIGEVDDPVTAETLETIKSPVDGVVGLIWCSPVIMPGSIAVSVGEPVD
jgi:predicted deacylase